MAKYLYLLLLALAASGCAQRVGFLCDVESTSCAKKYCFMGHGDLGGNAPFVAGNVIGNLNSFGVVTYGEVPESVMLEIAAQECPE